MKIIGTGSHLPSKAVKNADISNSDKWITETLGIKERRVTNKPTSFLATAAGVKAIVDANLKPSDIGLIIVATSTPDKLNPSTAVMVADNLGCKCPAFDLNAVCSGFIYALEVAYCLKSRFTLVIGADTFSQITDWTDRNCVFFGDGAGAVVVDTYTENMFFAELHADGSGRDVFTTPHGGTFEMDGGKVFKEGTTKLPKLIKNFLWKYWITEIDHVLPHQASVKMLRKLSEEAEIPWEKFHTNMDRYANTAAASIPILLDEVKNKFKSGEKILFASIGSGWTYGVAVLEW